MADYEPDIDSWSGIANPAGNQHELHPWMENQVKNSASFNRDALKDAAHLACDVKFVKSEMSPENFDEMVDQGTHYCAYIKDLQVKFEPALTRGQPIEHDFSADPKYPLAYGADFNQPRIEGWVQSFNENLRLLDQVKAATQRSDGEIVLALIAPFLIALALALRITKVTAELRPNEPAETPRTSGHSIT